MNVLYYVNIITLCMQILILLCGIFASFVANANYIERNFAPASIQGYTSYGSASNLNNSEMLASQYIENDEEKTAEASFIEAVRDEKLKKIQARYKAEGVKNLADDAAISVDDDEDSEEKHINKNPSTPSSVEITSEAFEQICSSLGYTKNTERDELVFHECVAFAMKTKLTEESIEKKEYTEIDSNIVENVEYKGLIDKTIENIIPYEKMITQRNKMDCLKQKDYHKCTKVVIEYKQCYNENVDYISIEHGKNKITCYTKTALRFANAESNEAYVRDAYFGMCMHLIEKDLKETFFKKNAECNQVLTKNGFLKFVI